MTKTGHILILLLTVLIVSCTQDMSLGPQNSSKLKSETKWLLANSDDHKITIVSKKQYDKLGQLIQSEQFDDKGVLLTQTVITYNQSQTIEEVKTFGNTGSPVVVKNIYTVDLKGMITEKLSQNSDGDTIEINKFNYDIKGNLVEETIYNKDGSLKSTTKFEYKFNEQGFVVGTRINGGGANQTSDTIIYKMDQRLVERIKFDSSGLTQVIYTYMYNTNGKVKKEIQTDKSGNILRKYEYEYIYFN